jgi:hypothetical protein
LIKFPLIVYNVNIFMILILESPGPVSIIYTWVTPSFPEYKEVSTDGWLVGTKHISCRMPMDVKVQYWGWKGGKQEDLHNKYWGSHGQFRAQPFNLNDKTSGEIRSVGSVGWYQGNSDEPTSLPMFGENSNIYRFEVGSSSSSPGNSVSSLTRSNSTLSFSTKSKKFDMGVSSNDFDCWSSKNAPRKPKCCPNIPSGGSPSGLNTPSGGSTRSLSSDGSFSETQRCLDWNKLVDNVFKEEIGKVTENWRF